MLVNLSHGANRTAVSESLPLWIQFDTGVDRLLELDRHTGQTNQVSLTNHRLEVTLVGGSGRLYKYDDGPFAPDTGPGPDPDGGLSDGAATDGGLVNHDGQAASDSSADGDAATLDGGLASDGTSSSQDAASSNGAGTEGGCSCRQSVGSFSAIPQVAFILFGLLWLLVRSSRRRKMRS